MVTVEVQTELGARAEGAQTSWEDRPGLELCPVLMTTMLFVEHLRCVLPCGADK